jgi:hypothetical protein
METKYTFLKLECFQATCTFIVYMFHWHIVLVLRLEYLKALTLSRLESFRALKAYRKKRGVKGPKAHLIGELQESFRTL